MINANNYIHVLYETDQIMCDSEAYERRRCMTSGISVNVADF